MTDPLALEHRILAEFATGAGWRDGKVLVTATTDGERTYWRCERVKKNGETVTHRDLEVSFGQAEEAL